MSAYVIVELTVKDPEIYREKYAPIAGQTAKEHEGEVIAGGNDLPAPTPTEDARNSE